MKKLLVVACAGLCSALFADTTLYVKPGGTGAGTSWADAADLATAVAAAREGTGVTTIYAAKGVYTLAATLKLNGNVALYGGFAGANMDETPATRDLKSNPTVISGDVNGDGVWTRYYPLTGTSEVTDEPIVKDGKINDLVLANEFDTYAPANKNHSDNLWRVVTVMENAAATCVLDGVTLTGGGRGIGSGSGTVEDGYRIDRGSTLFVASGATPVIRNCRIVGNTASCSCVFFNASTPTFEDNEISFNQSMYFGAFNSSNSSATQLRTSFIGNVRDSDINANGGAAVGISGALTLRNCSFTRNYLRKFRNNSPYEASCICGDDYAAFNVFDCSFFHNACYDTYGAAPAPMLMIYKGQKRITGNLFASNVTTVVSSAADVKVAGVVYWGGEREAMDGCTFADNEISVTAANATSVAAAPVYGPGKSGDCAHMIVNSTFTGNTVTVSAPLAAEKLVARSAVLAGTTGKSFVLNSTFAGDEALPDIVYRRTDEGATGLTVLNSVFWAKGAAVEVARIDNAGTAGAAVGCSVVCRPDLLDASVELSESTDENPLLQPLKTLVVGKPSVMQLGAMLPGVRDAYDVATFVYYGGTVYAYRRTPTSTWQNCYGSGGTKVLIGDAVGAARTAGNFTIGAVQSLTEKAENGLTVVYRMDPTDVARLEGKTTQVVDVGGTTEAVTGVSTNENYTFRRWRNEDGSEYSTENPVSVTAAAAGTLVLTAQFNPATVKYAFDLGEFATFDGDGETNKVLTVAPDSAVVIPAYTIRDGFSFKGWSPEVPATVGTVDAKFDLLAYRRDTYLKPGDDIATAVGEASRYAGGGATVHLAAGAYEPAADFVLPSNVKLVGEEGAVIRRSAQNQWTIKNAADKASSDKGWIEISGITFDRGGVYPGVNPVRLTDCVFTNCVNGENGALCLYTNAVVVNCGFYDGQMALKANGNNQWPIYVWATNCVFRGNRNASESGGRQFGAAAALSSCKATVFYGCRFEKNWSANKGSTYGILSGAAMTLDHCQFVDNVCTGDLNIVRLDYAATCKLIHTLFLRNRVVGDRGSSSTGYASIIGDGNLGDKQIVGCVFLSNVVDRTEAETKAGTTELPCAILYRNSKYQSLRYNFFEGNSVTATATNPETTPVCSVVTFAGDANDYSIEGNTFHDNVAADGVLRIRAGQGGAWIWNSLFSGTGAEATPISYASDEVTGQVHYRYTVAPVQSDARIIRDETCKTGPVVFGNKTVAVDGLIIRPIADASAARTKPVKWYFTSNGRKAYYNESLKAYRNLAGDCKDAYLLQPYTEATDMFGEVPEGRKALAGAYQNRVNYGLVIMFR